MSLISAARQESRRGRLRKGDEADVEAEVEGDASRCETREFVRARAIVRVLADGLWTGLCLRSE